MTYCIKVKDNGTRYWNILNRGFGLTKKEDSEHLITGFNWISGKQKGELVWDTKNKKVIVKPKTVALKKEL